jgi:alpha-amylase
MTNGSEGFKTMFVGKNHAGKTFVDACGNREEQIVIDEEGKAEFYANDRSVSVWIRKEALMKLKI